MKKRNCTNCTKEFSTYKKQDKVFCSMECYRDYAARRKVKFNCVVCGNEKKVSRSEYGGKYVNEVCSKKCSGKLKVINYDLIAKKSKSKELVKALDCGALVDGQYYEWASKINWHVSDTGYAMIRHVIDGKKKTVRLHRLIIDARPGEIVDHINRNKLDNRLENLRIVSHIENVHNSDRYDEAKGYYYSEERGSWIVDYRRISVRHKSFKTEQEAIRFVKNSLNEIRRNKWTQM